MGPVQDTSTFEWKTVRVFLSSTFRDFHAERDYLVKQVFPGLRQWCARWRLHLVDIDLRWGVTAFEAESGKVLDICLEQIDGSRPFFICMLGSRYGWVPGPHGIPVSTRERYDRLKGREDYSITHLEIHYAILGPLQSRKRNVEASQAFFFFRDGSALPEPVRVPGWSKEAREEYFRTFFECDPSGRKRLARLKAQIVEHFQKRAVQTVNADGPKQRVFTYRPRFDPAATNPEDDRLMGRFTSDSLRPFGRRVRECLQKAIRSQYAERIEALSRRAEEDELVRERDFHLSFIEDRARMFVGRAGIIRDMKAYVEGCSRRTFALLGDPGSGKSALLGRLYRECMEGTGRGAFEDVLVIPHFVGASPQSGSLNGLLRRLCREIFDRFLAGEMKKELDGLGGAGKKIREARSVVLGRFDIPLETSRLVATFHSFLGMAGGRIVLLLDALDQLDESDEAHELHWLPDELPPNVKIVVSATGRGIQDVLRGKCDRHLVVPPLTRSERREIVRTLPSVFCKTMEGKHIDRLLRKEETRNPLYLKVALEELRVFGSFEKLGRLIDRLPSDTVSLFAFFLERLERDYAEDRPVVTQFFSLLECSRQGLAETELAELILDDTRQVLPLLLRQVRDYLVRRGELIGFFHRDLSAAVRKKYDIRRTATRWREQLARYYERQPWFIKGSAHSSPVPNVRKLVEQPWQQMHHGGMDRELTATLCDPNFVEGKVRSSLVPELLEDYRSALARLPHADRVREFFHFVRSEGSHLKASGRHPWFAMQQAYNWADRGAVVRSSKRAIDRMSGTVLLLRLPPWRPAFNPSPAVVQHLDLGRDEIRKGAVAPDVGLAGAGTGLWNLRTGTLVRRFPGTILALSPDGRFAVVANDPPGGCCDEASHRSPDRMVELRDARSGVRVWGSRFTELEIGCAAIAVNGSRTVLAGGHAAAGIAAVFVVEGRGGSVVRRILGHSRSIDLLAATPDCRVCAVAKEGDAVVSVLDLRSGVVRQVLHVGEPGIRDLAITPDGRWVVSCTGAEHVGLRNTVHVWDAERGILARSLEGHWSWVSGVDVSADGRAAVSVGVDHTVRVWNLRTGSLARQLNIPRTTAFGIKITSDAGLAYTFARGAISALDAGTGRTPTKGHSHGHDVSCIALGGDAEGMISVGRDDEERTTALLWGVEKGNRRGSVDLSDGLPGYPRVAVLPPAGRHALVVSPDRWRRVDLGTGGLVFKCSLEKPREADNPLHLFYNDLALLSGRKELTVRDTRSGSPVRTMKTDLIDSFVTAVSSDGRLAAGGGRAMSVVDMETGSVLRTHLHDGGAPRFDPEHFSDIRFTPDGRSLVYVSTSVVAVYDLLKARRCRTLHEFPADVRLPPRLALTTDGRRAVFATEDGTAVWSFPRESVTGVFRGLHGEIRIMPNGRFAIVANGEAVHLVDLQDGITLGIFRWANGLDAVSDMAPDGTFALSGTGEVTVVRPENLEVSSPVTTAIRPWVLGRDGNSGAWDAGVRALCPWCRDWFSVAERTQSLIGEVGKNQRLSASDPPCHSLPEEAWETQGLDGRCPSCGRPLRFNPFLCDSSRLPGLFERDAGSFFTELDCEALERAYEAQGAACPNRQLAVRKKRTEAYRRLLNEHPDDRDTLLEHGRYAMSYGAYAEALRCFQRMQEHHPGDEESWLFSAEALDGLGDAKGSIAGLNRVIALNPAHSEARETIERLSAQPLRARMGIVSLLGEDAPAAEWRERGDFCNAQGRFPEALDCYRRYLEVKPDDGAVWLKNGLLAHRLGRADMERESYRRAMELYSGSGAAASLAAGADHAALLLQVAASLIELREFQAAGDFLDAAIELHPGHPALMVHMGRAILGKGSLFETPEVVELLSRVLSREANEPDAFALRSEANLRLGRYAKSLLDSDAALRCEANHPHALFIRGCICSETGRFTEAVRFFNRVLLLQPRHSQALTRKGWAQYAAGGDAAVRKMLSSTKKAVACGSDDPGAWTARGFALERIGNPEEAMACYDRALMIEPGYDIASRRKESLRSRLGHSRVLRSDRTLRSDPHDQGAWIERGLGLKDLMRWDEELECYERALAERTAAVFWCYKADCHRRLKQRTKAVFCLEKALAMQPDLAAARLSLDQLRSEIKGARKQEVERLKRAPREL